MTSTVLDHDAATGTSGAATGTSSAARGTVTVAAESSSPTIAPLNELGALAELAQLEAPSRTDVLQGLLAGSKGWQASLMGMLEAFPTAPTTPSYSFDAPGDAHSATTPARVLDGPDLLTRLDVLESLTRIAELSEAVKAHILTELDETDGIGHLSSNKTATSATSASSRTHNDTSSPAHATDACESPAGVDPSAGLDSLSDKDRARVLAARRALTHEVGFILKQSPYATSLDIARSRMLTKNLPMLLANLEAGRISITDTHAITTSLRDATSHHAQELDGPLARELERNPHAGKKHWRNFTTNALLSLDPATALEKEKTAFTKRRLTLKTLRNGMSSLTLTLRTLDATRIHDLLTHHAKNAHAILHQHEIDTATRQAHEHATTITTKLHALLANGEFTLHHLTDPTATPIIDLEREEAEETARHKAQEFLAQLEQEQLRLHATTTDGSPKVSVKARAGAWRGHYQKPAHTPHNLAVDALVETLLNTRPNHPTAHFAPASTAPGITLDPWTPLPHPHTTNQNLTHTTNDARQTAPPPGAPPETHTGKTTPTETTPTETSGVRGADRARRFDIGLLVPVNPDVSTAYIPNAGPITAETGFDYLNELLDNDVLVKYKRIFTNATTGEVLAMDSRSRLFPKALAELIRLRDRTCRGPYCNAPITHIDHIKRHAQGGPTTLTNAQGLCARCNLAKEALTVTHTTTTSSTTPHTTTWTTPKGRTYTSTTPTYDT
ncbi:HNH endonuclease [Dermabacter vaginalis]|uniref:HNH endonuclease n=1 Tax=Dermabacter vaginalis TaxID=1630135 RepID=UPI0028833BF2|nr:HNH endonuclease signature motif containing protein [Dermabacter vaginalis]